MSRRVVYPSIGGKSATAVPTRSSRTHVLSQVERCWSLPHSHSEQYTCTCHCAQWSISGTHRGWSEIFVPAWKEVIAPSSFMLYGESESRLSLPMRKYYNDGESNMLLSNRHWPWKPEKLDRRYCWCQCLEETFLRTGCHLWSIPQWGQASLDENIIFHMRDNIKSRFLMAYVGTTSQKLGTWNKRNRK